MDRVALDRAGYDIIQAPPLHCRMINAQYAAPGGVATQEAHIAVVESQPDGATFEDRFEQRALVFHFFAPANLLGHIGDRTHQPADGAMRVVHGAIAEVIVAHLAVGVDEAHVFQVNGLAQQDRAMEGFAFSRPGHEIVEALPARCGEIGAGHPGVFAVEVHEAHLAVKHGDADRRHRDHRLEEGALGLQLLPRVNLLGDIDDRAQRAGDRAVGGANRQEREIDIASLRLPIELIEELADDNVPPGREHPLEHRADAGHQGAPGKILQAPAQHLGAAVAGDLFPGIVDQREVAAGVGHGERDLHVVDQRRQPFVLGLQAGGVVAQAAAELGLSRQALYRRMERLGIARP